MAKNDLIRHFFLKGMSADLSPNAEGRESYEYALNGRLYMKNQAVNYTSVDGTIKVFENADIVKILGYASFIDELVLFVKAKGEIAGDNQTIIGYDTVTRLVSKSFSTSSTGNLMSINYSSRIELFSYDIPIYDQEDDDVTVNVPISCVDEFNEPIDYSDYYEEVLNFSNIQFCQLQEQTQYENNKKYLDAIISIKKDSQGNFVDEVLWKGLLNWDINGKIITHAVTENSNYKRIYFTDDQTPFKAINLKDKQLKFRKEDELNSFQKSILLQPIVESIENNGIIKSSVVIYAYRLITANGQTTPFSSFSKEVIIYPDREIFEGGKVSETTTRSVNVKINLVNHQTFDEVELVAIEFEAFGSPTTIRQIGKKKVSSVVRFTHYGNEPMFSGDLTMSEILDRKTNWNYCSDIESKNNKLIAVGLRNDPMNTDITNVLKQDFTLHGWDSEGKSHACLINPNPEKYRFINASMNAANELYYVNKRVYSSIKVFGNFTVSFVNKETGYSISKSFENKKAVYQEWINEIYEWLSSSVTLDNFPNLGLSLSNNHISLDMLAEPHQVDIMNYAFEFNNNQVIQDYENQIVFNNLDSYGQMVYGAQSLGFNKGNGIRITYRVENEKVLTKATGKYPDQKPLLNMPSEISLRKGFMKGEIYRLAFLPYDSKGNELFAIPLGDIMIPMLGEEIKYIDDSGVAVFESKTYTNSFVEGNDMYAQRIVLNVEVRISCDLKDKISMYKLLYVERTGLNKSILAQGISAPLERIQQFTRTENVNILEQVANKWRLPSQGGPLYDKTGLELWDRKPNGPFSNAGEERILVNRKLMYFDSPDLIYGRESASLVNNCKIQRVGRLNIENDPWIKNTFNPYGERHIEVYPKFSRKIFLEDLAGDDYRVPENVNVTVFLERRGPNDYIDIEYSEEMQPGSIIPGYNFGENYEISNNAMTTQHQSWYWSYYGRRDERCRNGEEKSGLLKSNNYSPGRKTVIIKAKEDVFSDSFINTVPFFPPFVDRDITSPDGTCAGYDTHGLFNLVMNNRENIYGGRSERNYTNNIYVSLSDTIPVNVYNNGAQKFIVTGDVYSTLFIRNKNIYNDDNVWRGFSIRNGGNCNEIGDDIGIARNGAWCYAFVVESMVEPKLDYTNSFWKQSGAIDFSSSSVEAINEAYYQTNTLKSYIPVPLEFKDDPDMGNICAVSETKLNGSYIDAYLTFKVNNFYELEREKGKAYNIVSDLSNVYVIQEFQTSRIFIDENTMMDTSNGPISIQQGDGQGISNHQVISDFGTSIRRNAVSSVSSAEVMEGFTFFDEHKKEFVKTNKPMLFSSNLHLDFLDRFKNEIVDVEGWFDYEFKETNLRLRFENDQGITLSYNEKFQTFNGYMNYNEDLYMVWNRDVFTTENKYKYFDESQEIEEVTTPYIHQLNKGLPMNFIGKQYNMIMKVTSNIQGDNTLIFKDWKGTMNINYPVKQFRLKTNYTGSRIVNGTHHRYFIKEATHSCPLKNRNDRDDLRGDWMEMEVEIESKNGQSISLYSFTNFVRNSYQ